MTNAVATYTHFQSNKSADVIRCKRTLLPYTAGQDKELRAKTALAKFGCSNQEIGGVSIVERDRYSFACGMRSNPIEDRQEAIMADPIVGFARLKLTHRLSNPVEINDAVLTYSRHPSPACFPEMQQLTAAEPMRRPTLHDATLPATTGLRVQ